MAQPCSTWALVPQEATTGSQGGRRVQGAANVAKSRDRDALQRLHRLAGGAWSPGQASAQERVDPSGGRGSWGQAAERGVSDPSSVTRPALQTPGLQTRFRSERSPVNSDLSH